jgi:ribosomal protein S18 acetylase RimI-like enzyme
MPVRTFDMQDAEEMVALKRRIAATTGALVHPPGFYTHYPGFAGGANIRCVDDEEGRLIGFGTASVYPLPEEPDLPRQVWLDLRADPERTAPDEVRDALLEALFARLREVAEEDPGRAVCPYAGGFSEETESLAYYRSRGFVHEWRMFWMHRDLAQPLAEAPLAAGVEVRHSRLESEAERESYLRLHNACFPTVPMDTARLVDMLHWPLWENGMALLAWAGEELVGSAMAYWEQAEGQPRGEISGTVDNVFVAPAWRRRGLATHLVTKALRLLQNGGLRSAGIQVRADNVGAAAVYRSVGYETQREVIILDYREMIRGGG